MREHLQENRNEQRRAKRVPRRHAAWIELAGHDERIPCVLWDISEGGARVAAPRVNTLPAVFHLALTDDGLARPLCRVVWRSERQVGVQFIAGSIEDFAHEAVVPAPVAPANVVSPGSSDHGLRVAEFASQSSPSRVGPSSLTVGVLLIVAATTALFFVAAL